LVITRVGISPKPDACTVEYFHSQRQLADPIRALLFAVASGIDRNRYPRDRDGRLLVRMMNHGWLLRHLPANQHAVRAVYDAIEAMLGWDYHYWLQRGSFEVEAGDLQLAQNFLEQARALAPDDYRVQTEWGYMVIKRAVQNAYAPDSRERVEDALAELEDAVIRRGDHDSYPAHVMGSQGLAWVRHGPLSHDEQLILLRRLRHVVDGALERHPSSSDLRQLRRDLEEAYLLAGAVDVN
jgi:tetratricopeptide (TPR) repeat protein